MQVLCRSALLLLAAAAAVSGFHATPSSTRATLRWHAQQPNLQQRRGSSSALRMADAPYERIKKGIFETEGELDYIFDSNKAWVKDVMKQDPGMFERLKNAQQPKYLYIGCSDSRVPAQNMLGLTTGELFVHRNVANLCVNTDYSLLSVLTYAVEVLEVTDIIVCGHYGCGGVKAAMENKDHGLLEHWLMHIRNVQRLHQAELASIPSEEQRHQRLVELNVQEACMNLFANPVVQKKQAMDAQPRIHGWVYDISSGYLKDLKIDFRSEIRKYKKIYSLYEFPRSGSAPATTAADTTTIAANGANGASDAAEAKVETPAVAAGNGRKGWFSGDVNGGAAPVKNGRMGWFRSRK